MKPYPSINEQNHDRKQVRANLIRETVIRLRTEGLSYRQIAEQMGLDISVVKAKARSTR